MTAKLERTDRYMKFIQHLYDEYFALENEKEMWMRQYIRLSEYLWKNHRIHAYEIE